MGINERFESHSRGQLSGSCTGGALLILPTPLIIVRTTANRTYDCTGLWRRGSVFGECAVAMQNRTPCCSAAGKPQIQLSTRLISNLYTYFPSCPRKLCISRSHPSHQLFALLALPEQSTPHTWSNATTFSSIRHHLVNSFPNQKSKSIFIYYKQLLTYSTSLYTLVRMC